MTRQQLSPEEALRGIYLSRLQRLVRLRREYVKDVNHLGLRLLDVCIKAAYADCCEMGDKEIAAPIMALYEAQS